MLVYDKTGKAFDVKYPIDVKDWLAAGYTIESPKAKNKPPKEDIKEDIKEA